MMDNFNRKGLKEKTAKVAKCLTLCPPMMNLRPLRLKIYPSLTNMPKPVLMRPLCFYMPISKAPLNKFRIFAAQKN